MLSVNLWNVLWTVINLLILYFLIKKFLFKRVDEVLEKRQLEIEEASKEADMMIEEAKKTKAEYLQRIELADEEKEQILADIKKQGYDEYERIVNDARRKGEQIVTEAKHNAEVENERVKEVYAAQLADMVVEAASKIAATKHSTENDRELYDKFISEAGAKNE
ncbi:MULTISPECIES: ATP synthase F0 subunit B [unclassified Butyrivibrio]|uniref:ATP synthase F0 subunit B n=1 Tax=unclassified Butyrivibrio TaxID=2639466 RepID=UPI00040B7378|nr:MULTISPECIES: ATP synthase F0 subunit B [unclassified Butyrivibrio]MDC7293938.1 ATP synthase F0 subunit B [Butyrivibrio sp. DSM 10294]